MMTSSIQQRHALTHATVSRIPQRSSADHQLPLVVVYDVITVIASSFLVAPAAVVCFNEP